MILVSHPEILPEPVSRNLVSMFSSRSFYCQVFHFKLILQVVEDRGATSLFCALLFSFSSLSNEHTVLFLSLETSTVSSLALPFSSLFMVCQGLRNWGHMYLFCLSLPLHPLSSPGIPVTRVLDGFVFRRALRLSLCPRSSSSAFFWLICIDLSSSSQVLSPTASFLSLSGELFIYVILLLDSRNFI